MIKKGTKVKIKDLLTLLSLSENEGRPFVNSEMKLMAEKVFYIQNEDMFWLGSNEMVWYTINGWRWSRDMFDILEEEPTPEYFLKLLNKKFKNENKISLFDLAVFIEEELYE
jgi:hypothetical protein